MRCASQINVNERLDPPARLEGEGKWQIAIYKASQQGDIKKD
jgi:hypothetical protein